MGKRRTKHEETNAPPKLTRHRLLSYLNLGWRYRPPALLLIFMGVFALMPYAIADLQNDLFDPESLAVVGVVVILAGVAFWLFSLLAARRAYVLCRPDLMVVRTPFYRTLVSYRRVKDVRAVPVNKLYEDHKFKGIAKPLMKPLKGSMAVVVYMKSWPKPKRLLRRFFSPYLFVPNKDEDAWVFIVPNYNVLVREIEEFRLRKLDEDRISAYQDPIDRLKHYSR